MSGATRLLSVLMVLIGLAMIVRTLAGGGGPVNAHTGVGQGVD